ncbi:MAG: sigma-70 family RNA polymerase sigma factor [Muribaculaceae bacterium]|nr:sigma-70 family RNA polymerase sigma factor [Muribaculaceae bacterium]
MINKKFQIDFESLEKILKEQNLWELDELSFKIFQKEIRKYKTISAPKEIELTKLIRKGNVKSRNDLVLSFIPLVIKIAKKYQNLGLNLNDLISEGILGLIRAAEKYDESRGYKFTSYAGYRIRSAIINAIENYSDQIKIPINVLQDLNRIKKLIDHWNLYYEIIPSEELLSELKNISVERIHELCGFKYSYISIDSLGYYLNNLELVDEIINLNINPIRINDFCCKDSYNVDKIIRLEDLRLEIEESLNQLYDREREILKMYYGIGCVEMSFEEIGDKFDLTKERVRQIKEKAVKRLRGQKSKNLREYLG